MPANLTTMYFSSAHTTLPNREKVGNLIVYIASKVSNLYLTKLLKLLYIIDEESVIETGVPVTWLPYNVWKMGPVPTGIYYDLTLNNTEYLSEFVEAKPGVKAKGIEITPKKAFEDAEFSDFEMELIDRIITKYGHLNSKELVELLHKEDSLWHKIVKEQGLEKKFELEETKTSPFVIELSDKIKNDPYKLHLYQTVKESLQF